MVPPSQYWVYVLWSPDHRRFYIGLTDDVQRRLAQHNQGRSFWTRRYAGSWQLAFQRAFDSLSDARRFELTLKRQKCGCGFWKLTGLDPARFAAPQSKPSSPSGS